MSQSVRVRGSSRRRIAAGLWAALLTVVLLAPMFSGSGHFLARDLVFLPHHPLTWQSLGLGDGSPRAVPLDGWVSLLTTVIDGGVLARVVVPGFLILAAVGVLRLLPDLGVVPLMVASGAVVWNPFVAERLALGQWALLACYAALPWLLSAVHDHGRDPSARNLGATVPWIVLGSLTPSGGVIVTGLLGIRWVLRRPGALLPLLASVAVQAPWVVAAAVGASGRVSDVSGVAAFAPDTESRWGTAVALLGLSGIWDSFSEPGSRLTVLGPLTALVVVGVLVLRLRQVLGTVPEATALALASAGGLFWALLLIVAPGRALAEAMMATLPGAGLLRDGQKFLLPLVLLVPLAAGLAVQRLAEWVRGRGVGSPEVLVAGVLPVVLAPVLLLPDAARVVWPTVQPVQVPDSFARMDEVTRDTDGHLVTLPWRSYRDFRWGSGTTSSDPATRLLHVPVLASDDLQVGRRTIPGEGALAARVGRELASGEPPSSLGHLGVSWVVLYLDDPEVGDIRLDGLGASYRDDYVALYRVPDRVARPEPSLAARTAVAAAHGLLLLALVLALAGRYRRLGRRAR